MTDRLADLFAPFLADAAGTVAVRFAVETRPDRDVVPQDEHLLLPAVT